jgi:hypothetical protein
MTHVAAKTVGLVHTIVTRAIPSIIGYAEV